MSAVFDCWIEEVNRKRKEFTAILNWRKRKWIATLSFEDVPEEDRHLITIGQLFLMKVSDDDKPLIVMSKLPDWTEEERQQMERRAKELFKNLKSD